ncbi:MAG: DciA family protein [Acidobacteriota bacterium]
MKPTPIETFVRLDSLADGLLRRMNKGDTALLWLRSRWGRIVGEPLARKIQPTGLSGRRLTISLLDPTWKKPVEATLPELERRLAEEMPELKPKIILKP